MKALMAFFKRIQISKLVVACLLGTVLLTMTACNNGDELGARPNNPPVQMGGQNNPYKMGGDGYNQYKSTLDPNVKTGDHSSLNWLTGELVATNMDNNDAGILYPGSNGVKSANSKDDFVSPKRREELLDPTRIPAQKQSNFDRSDPDAKLLEKVGQTFKDASDFLVEPFEADQGNRSPAK